MEQGTGDLDMHDLDIKAAGKAKTRETRTIDEMRAVCFELTMSAINCSPRPPRAVQVRAGVLCVAVVVCMFVFYGLCVRDGRAVPLPMFLLRF
jgi:hypothetical protein